METHDSNPLHPLGDSTARTDSHPLHQLGHVTSSRHNPFGIEGYTSSTYGDSFADIYDEWYESLDDDDFVASIVRDLPRTPVRVLELGVGTGRLVAQFLSLRPDANDTIIGIDSSDAMISRASARHFPASVSLTVGDFSQSLPDGPFDAIFVGYNTLFNLPNADALQSCLSLVAERLSPTGTFSLDVVHPTNDEYNDDVTVRHMTTGEVVLAVSSHNPDDQRITGQFIQFTNGATVKLRPWSVRYFSPAQLDSIAEAAGLRLVSRHSDGNGAPFTESSRRLISTYKKA